MVIVSSPQVLVEGGIFLHYHRNQVFDVYCSLLWNDYSTATDCSNNICIHNSSTIGSVSAKPCFADPLNWPNGEIIINLL